MELYIITGASRGLGAALARQGLAAGHEVIGISRTSNAAFAGSPEAAGGAWREELWDLADTAALADRADRLFAGIDGEKYAAVSLINNAGVLQPMGPIHLAAAAELTGHVQVNLLAPMLLQSAFIRAACSWPAPLPRRVVHISSGAGRRPYEGWGAYCSTKAALDMLTRCTGLEQGEGEGAVKVLSIAPGVVETGMQELIRETPAEQFPERDKFRQLHESGGLYTPKEAARRILGVLSSPHAQQGAVLDVRQLPELG